MSIINSPFPMPSPNPGWVGKVLRGIGKVAKYAWNVITGQDEKQDEIAGKKGINPEKSSADEIAELNKLLVEYRQNISASANDMEREMIVECSMMLQDIMEIFDEYNQKLKIVRSESVKRKFNRICKDLKGTFAKYVEKRISLDDAECVKILRLPAGELKNQRLQEIKQKVFVEAGNEVIKQIEDAVKDFSETVEDTFEEHIERIEEKIENQTDAFEKLNRVVENDTNSVESVLLKSNYLLAVCSYADTLI